MISNGNQKQNFLHYDLTDIIENLKRFSQEIKYKKGDKALVFFQEDLEALFLLINGIPGDILTLFAKDSARFRKEEKET